MIAVMLVPMFDDKGAWALANIPHTFFGGHWDCGWPIGAKKILVANFFTDGPHNAHADRFDQESDLGHLYSVMNYI